MHLSPEGVLKNCQRVTLSYSLFCITRVAEAQVSIRTVRRKVCYMLTYMVGRVMKKVIDEKLNSCLLERSQNVMRDGLLNAKKNS